MAHEHGMLCLADEAHGTHFYFGKDLPISAMEAGADMASVSMHKSGGSLTQSSFLLAGPNVNPGYIRQIINLTQTTSGSYLLMSSLDISRRNLALRGEEIFGHVRRIAEYARGEINSIGGYYAFGPEMINGNSIFDFDPIKLSVHTLDIGLAGIEVYDLLRDDYDIQIELGETPTEYSPHIDPTTIKLTGCGKRNNHVLRDEGLTSKCVIPIEHGYDGEYELHSVVSENYKVLKK